LLKAAKRLYIAAMQDETSRERLRRSEAAAYARRRLGQSVKVNTLRSWPIPYRQVGRDAVYELADLDRFIDARLKAAPVRRAQWASRALAAVYETRRKLIVGNVGADEAHRRAAEWAVNEYRRCTGAGLEEAKQAVRAAIAKAKERV
jgi:ribosomal protein L7/L12